MSRNTAYVELTLPEWAVPLAADLLRPAVARQLRSPVGSVRPFRFEGSRFDRLGVEAELVGRRLPFDVCRHEMTPGGACRSAERKIRFDADGALEVDLEDIPEELGSVYIGLMETVHSDGERQAVDAFLQSARRRRMVPPLNEVAPLPEQVARLRDAEETLPETAPWRRVF